MWKRRVGGLLQALLAVVLVAWALRQVGGDWTRLAESPFHWGWLLLGLFFGFLSVLGWAWRWLLMLRAVGFDFSFREIWRLTFIADFFNLYFLGPMGADGARFAMLSPRAKGKRVELLASLAVDHLLGLQALALAFFLFTLPRWAWVDSLSSSYRGVVRGAAVVLAVSGLATGSVLWPIGRRLIAGFFRRFSRSKVGTRIVSTMECLDGQSGKVWASLGISFLSLCCAYGAFWSAARALEAKVWPGQLFGLMPIVDVYAMLPFTVSGLGIRENLMLELLGQEDQLGAARAVAMSLAGFFCIGVWGLVGGLILAMPRKEPPREDAPP